jgi:hypothetical protein
MMNQAVTIEEMQHMFNWYKRFSNEWKDARFQEFAVSFGHVKTALHAIMQLSAKLERHRATGFNIFQILKVESNEVRTHSAVLSELLTPSGSHGQGHLFLKSFLRTCREISSEKKKDPFPMPGRKNIEQVEWFVDKEKVTSFGRIDLVIRCPELKFAILIENKIWAHEQPDQLERYQEWLKAQREFYAHSALIYLTLDGSKSNTAKKDGDYDYYRLSYNEHIPDWLRDCLSEIQANHVRETVNQYLMIIISLCTS